MNTKQNRGAEAFLKRAQNDVQLREQLQQIKTTGKERLAEIVRIATAAGFNFSTQEYEEADNARLTAKGMKGCQTADDQRASMVGTN
jgi:predicted ribosomally synthesized peptide with nif11-like leader